MKRLDAPSPKRPITPEAKKNLILIIANSLLSLLVYFSAMNLKVTVLKAGVIAPYPITLGLIVSVVYWIAFAGMLLGYIIYNRGFTRKNVTLDMLPDTWSKEKKEEFIADGKRRFEKSKWMLSVILPLLVTIAADAICLFTWPLIENLLF